MTFGRVEIEMSQEMPTIDWLFHAGCQQAEEMCEVQTDSVRPLTSDWTHCQVQCPPATRHRSTGCLCAEPCVHVSADINWKSLILHWNEWNYVCGDAGANFSGFKVFVCSDSAFTEKINIPGCYMNKLVHCTIFIIHCYLLNIWEY